MEPVGWIPVEEHLPKEDGTYLVTVTDRDQPCTLYLYETAYWEEGSGWDMEHIVAWLPGRLPNPYKPD